MNPELLNKDIRKRIDKAGARFLFEVDIASKHKQKIVEYFISAVKSKSLSSTIRLWVRNYPTLNMVLLSEIARQAYNQEYRGYWNNFYNAVGIETENISRSNIESMLGNAFISELRARMLETEIIGFTYVSPILAHSGLPENSYQEFIEWLVKLEPGVKLSAFADISSTDFLHNLQQWRNIPCSSRLRCLINHEEGYTMIWSMANYVGECAVYVECGNPCPLEWHGTFLERLYDAVKKYYSGNVEKLSSVHFTGLAPIILWDYDNQSIVSGVPEQRAVRGAEMHLIDGFGSQNGLTIGTNFSDELIEEIIGTPLTREDKLYAKVKYKRNGQEWKVRELEYTGKDPIIFDEHGLILRENKDNCYPTGEYLALYLSDIDGIPGVTLTEDLMEPVGWFGWRGSRIICAEGAQLGPFKFQDKSKLIKWEVIGQAGQSNVTLLNERNLWLNKWPDILVKNRSIEEICRYVLQVELLSSNQKILKQILLKLGDKSDVPLIKKDDGVVLVLSKMEKCKDLQGHIRIKLRTPDRAECPVINFVRLVGVHIDYIAIKGEISKGVSLSGKNFNVLVLDGKEREREYLSGGVMRCSLYPTNPVKSPDVRFIMVLDGHSDVILRVKVPVNRISLVTSKSTLGNWSELPLRLSLDNLSVDDRLKIETLEPISYNNGQSLCRIVLNTSPFVVGKATKNPYIVEIPLIRLKDTLGSNPRGMLQIKGTRGWLDIVDFYVPVDESLPQKLKGIEQKIRSNRIDKLQQAQLNFAWDDIKAMINPLLDNTATVIEEEELLRVAGANAALWLGDYELVEEILSPLMTRSDINEVRLFLALACARAHYTDTVKINRLHNEISQWPSSMEKKIVEIELNYRGIKLNQRKSGALKSCRRGLDLTRYLKGPLAIDYALIDVVTGFLLNFDISDIKEYISGDPTNEAEKYLYHTINVLKELKKYLNSPLSNYQSKGLLIDDTLLRLICHPMDIAYIKLCLAQSEGRYEEAASMLDNHFTTGYADFYGLELIKYRQEKARGNEQVAAELYKKIFDKYEFLIEE